MNKIYYLLLILLIIIGAFVVSVLVKRANQADSFFEYQKSQQDKIYERD